MPGVAAVKPGVIKNLLKAGLRSAIGFYSSGERVAIVEAMRTPFGLAGIRSRRIEDDDDSDTHKGHKEVRALLSEILERERMKTVTVGVRPSAVDFVADADLREEAWDGGAGEGKSSAAAAVQAAPGVLIDSIGVTVAKTKFVLTGRVRSKEIEGALPDSDSEDLRRRPRFEPGPWAAWRASLYFAPLKHRSGVHLRYILGEQEGLAILGDRHWPLAWQVLSWRTQDKGAALVQAFHMLNLYARRQLSISEIRHVSVQGCVDLEEGWHTIEAPLGREVEQVVGPVYDDEFIALGLALGGLESEENTLDLGRSLRPPKTFLALLPWKELGFLATLFLGMFFVMSSHAGSLRTQLDVALHENAEAIWAKAVPIAELQSQQKRLAKDVQPLSRFFSKRIPFAPALAAVSSMIPPTAWVESLHGADYVWRTGASRTLGSSFLLVRYAAPLVNTGAVPEEINELVKGLKASPYFSETLPEVKLADINWKPEGGEGVTLFTVIAKPRGR